MKTSTRLGLVALICGLGLLVIAAQSRDDQWKKVEDAIKKGLPKTAIEHLNPIIEQAMKDKKYPEAIKAIAKKVALEGNIQGNKPEEKIVRMQAEIARAPKEMTPVMDAILANWYWHYFLQNRWRFMQRTATAPSPLPSPPAAGGEGKGEGAPGDDITTWDLRRIFAEIDKQFARALAAEKELKATPIAEYNALLEKGTMPDSYRPTLYDFVAHEALHFYVAGEQGLAKAEDHFELEASSPIFAPVDEFLKWEVQTTDQDSRTVKAIKLYQDLLRFHKERQDKNALLDADLGRLAFGYNKAFGEEKNARFKAALKDFAEQHKDHETSALARFRWGSVLSGENDLVEAHKVAQEGNKAFPNSPGGKLCYNLVQQIEAKSSQVSTERVWNNPWPTVQVRYRNLTKVYFRAVAANWTDRLSGRYRPEQLDQNERKALLAKKAVREWSADLPATRDYQERTQEITPPKDLKPGFYFLIASHDPAFNEADNVVSFTDFWVSDLALVMRNHQGDGVVEGFVLNANTGEPIAGAQIQVWLRDPRNNQAIAAPGTKTDKNGLFKLQGAVQNGYLILASHGGQQLAAGNDYYSYRGDYTPRPYARTIFFTDRSLYRPGQTVQYKGICIDINQANDNYQTLADRTLTVIFADPNGKEISRQQHKTNEYGSFSGSVTAPRDRLLGHMTLRVEGEPPGATGFNVEEYKRPKFEVKLEAPKEAAKLNAEVSLQGKATAYTGVAIGGAQVRYRVVREVRYPPWWYWCYWWRQPKTDSQEIAHGFALTEPDGSFNIKFVAKPDPSVPEKDEPTFHYTVSADVTDATGETRSGQRTVNVAYTALKASLTADDWQTNDKEVKITVKTQTHDDEGQAAKATLKVYRLKQPEKVQRAELQSPYYPRHLAGGREPKPDPSNPNSWPLGEVVAERAVATDDTGTTEVAVKLDAGIYRAMLETKDRFGKPVTARLPLQVLKPDAAKLNVKLPNLVAAPKWSVEPGQEFQALWGTGYDSGRAFVEIEHRGKTLQSYWTDAQVTQALIKQAVKEEMRGGFTLRVTMVRENRAYLTSHHVNVPWTNKDLTVKWEHFTSKLGPGQKETWTAVITGPDAKKAVAEMVATLYDQSLDAYLPHNWLHHFGVFRQDHSRVHTQFENMVKPFQYLQGQWPHNYKEVQITYRALPQDIVANLRGYQFFDENRGANFARPDRGIMPGLVAGKDGAPLLGANRRAPGPGEQLAKGEAAPAAEPTAPAQAPPMMPNLDQVSARKNLNETAFFFPRLISDDDGKVKMEFTMPEALTRWKFMGFAHDSQLRAGFLQDEVVTAKDLMVQPNPPRFLREGDSIEFTAKVSNQSPAAQKGTVRLTLADARTGQSVDARLGVAATDQAFDIAPKESRTFSWRLQVPDGMGPLTYKTVASSGKLSDGEEGYLPVLSRYVLFTESLPLPIRGKQTKTFEFAKLRDADLSKTLKHQNLTVQMTSNPAWYAVMALPYLMEYPYECSEQQFNRLYANALAHHIANSDPKIHKVFEQWRGTPALDSPLEKNQELKAVVLEETPWLRQAQAESQARRNVGILFDDNRLNIEKAVLTHKLAQMQLPDGAWPWFPGGPGNDYITLYITTGFGRLRHLGVSIDTTSAVKSLNRLDLWIDRVYRDIVKHGRQDKNNLSPTIALYLYGRSFFLTDMPIKPEAREAVDYFLGQAQKHWLQLANRQSQAHLAVALKRFEVKDTPAAIMKSIKERSVSNEELGMFWRDTELSYWWYRAPIETQAVMIEAFDEVTNDAAAVEDCKVWLLKQKQTQDWKTTKATADAVYALLLRRDNLLKSDALVEVTLGATKIQPDKVEAGTGFYEQRFGKGEITSQMAGVTVKKTDDGVAWGAVHWQYLEDMAKVTPHDGTPLKLTKTLYTKQYTKSGPVLQPVAGSVKVGDELVVRVVLKTDRDMEYVHLKDYRGSGTEPVNVLSRYRYQDGLGYYETTRDTATHFFIDYLPKGTYVFEYPVRVQLKGQYQSGIAQIQCMYAPEFNSHSESVQLEVK
jgi:uncharacterized protein YfaS (alpha-2-macroglobulin family)